MSLNPCKLKTGLEKIKGYQKIQSWILHVKKYFVATNVCCKPPEFEQDTTIIPNMKLY